VLGLARLGRARLALDPFPQDRTLGLGPVGSIAFTGFALLFAIAVPIVIADLDDSLTTTIALLVLLVSVPVFFLSMWRLHRQMTEAKTRYIEEARRLYAAAYEPVRTNPTVETLRQQSDALSAAQALEDRAHKILEWPISEGVTAVIAVIFVGVVTSLIVRVIFIAAGY
jgi:ABC-type multidrug transport system fused ATPase/permease subunit